jgi:hypothetical protein
MYVPVTFVMVTASSVVATLDPVDTADATARRKASWLLGALNWDTDNPSNVLLLAPLFDEETSAPEISEQEKPLPL